MQDEDELAQRYQDVLKAKRRLDGMLSACSHGKVKTVAEEQALIGLMHSLKDRLRQLEDLCVSRTSFLSKSIKSPSIMIRRVEKLVDDCKILIFAAERELKIFARQVQADREREALLSRGAEGEASRRRAGAVMDEANLLDERERLDQSATMVIGAIEQGKLSLYNLMNQKQLLQGSRKKLHTAFATAGVSAATLTSIEARLRSDSFIVYGGIGIVSILIYVFFCWWTGIHVFWWFPWRAAVKLVAVLDLVWRGVSFLPRVLMSSVIGS